MNSIHFLDWAIISLYFLSLIYIGIIRQKNERQSESGFILSGRKLSLTGFIATLVTTWYGAILGKIHFFMVYRRGLFFLCPIIFLQ